MIRRVATTGAAWPLAAVTAFVRGRSDGGRRVQALVAAALDLVHPDVRARRVNDPSRDYAGDIHVWTTAPTLAVEARDRIVTEQDVEQFVARSAAKNVRRAGVAAFVADQQTLDDDALQLRALEEHTALLKIWYAPEELLRWCAMQSAETPDVSWGHFAERMLRRLEQIQAPDDTIADWVGLVEAVAGGE